jgi:hypothetical protein
MITILLTTVFVICACGKKDGAQNGSSGGTEPEKAVAAALDALAKVDTATFNSYVSSYDVDGGVIEQTLFPEGDALTEEDVQLYTAYFKNLTYKISDVSVDGENAVVKATITNSDFSTAMEDLYSISQQSGSEDAFNISAVVDMLNGITKTIVSDVDITLIKAEDKWEIVANEYFINAIYGNLYALNANESAPEQAPPEQTPSEQTPPEQTASEPATVE